MLRMAIEIVATPNCHRIRPQNLPPVQVRGSRGNLISRSPLDLDELSTAGSWVDASPIDSTCMSGDAKARGHMGAEPRKSPTNSRNNP